MCQYFIISDYLLPHYQGMPWYVYLQSMAWPQLPRLLPLTKGSFYPDLIFAGVGTGLNLALNFPKNLQVSCPIR